MSGVFQNIDPQPSPLVRGEDTLAGWRGGWGVNILEDTRHSSVLDICKYFVLPTLPTHPPLYLCFLTPIDLVVGWGEGVGDSMKNGGLSSH
jgi:hypothetical protein